MKKLFMAIIMTVLFAVSSMSSFAASNFVVDFEDPSMFGFKTISFKDSLNPLMEFKAQTGFTGKALVAPITSVDQAIWWVTGLGLDKAKSSEVDFKNLKDITFSYKSTVAFTDSPFIIQLVWKNKADAAEVASIEYAFPVVKDVITKVTVPVPAAVKTKLDTKTGYYLDWIMVGLKADAINDEFRSGTFIYDTVSFNKMAAVATQAPVTNPTTADNNNAMPIIVTLVALVAITGTKVLSRKANQQ